LKPFQAILIDDEQHCLDTLSGDLARYCPDIELLGQFGSSEQALAWLKGNRVDVVFLDIVMPGLTGFQLLERLSPVPFQVIFTTAYSEFAVKALRASAVDFLEKPIDKDELMTAVERLKERSRANLTPVQLAALLYNLDRSNPVKRLGLPTREGLEFVPVPGILYCSADGNYSRVFFEDGSERLISRSLKEMENLLSEYPFCRIHHAYLVNLEHVTRFLRGDGGSVILVNGQSLPVSRQKKPDFLANWKT
jgi:two-component system LytT family response regulator